MNPFFTAELPDTLLAFIEARWKTRDVATLPADSFGDYHGHWGNSKFKNDRSTIRAVKGVEPGPAEGLTIEADAHHLYLLIVPEHPDWFIATDHQYNLRGVVEVAGYRPIAAASKTSFDGKMAEYGYGGAM